MICSTTGTIPWITCPTMFDLVVHQNLQALRVGRVIVGTGEQIAKMDNFGHFVRRSTRHGDSPAVLINT